MNRERELLGDLSEDELEALADSVLAPSAQARLDELLDRNTNGQLGPTEQSELDCLLDRVDHLTVLKTRAKLTLGHKAGVVG
jgi:ribosome assembly protein YihI (activator of Der GTPase)